MNQAEHQLDYLDLVTLRILDADCELAERVSSSVNLRYGVVRQVVGGVGFTRIISIHGRNADKRPVRMAHIDYVAAMLKRDFAGRWYSSNGTLKRVRSAHVRGQINEYFAQIPQLMADLESPDWDVQARAYSRLAHGV